MVALPSKIKQLMSLTSEIHELMEKRHYMERNLGKFRRLVAYLPNDTILYGDCELYFSKAVTVAHENYMTTQINEMTDAIKDRESRIAQMLKD